MVGDVVGVLVGTGEGTGVGEPAKYVGDELGWNDGVNERCPEGTGVGLPASYVGATVDGLLVG
jgi:hypothetical protein